MDAHPEELAKHRGERIAVHPTRGIIASGPTLTVVCAALDAAGVPDDEALLVVVPDL
ncbi:MAG: hypothetical protein HY909_03855 [Deltaproteobacteria bacterium]|nr:hypothetical protein [Deltaproteobacteria bacterium]